MSRSGIWGCLRRCCNSTAPRLTTSMPGTSISIGSDRLIPRHLSRRTRSVINDEQDYRSYATKLTSPGAELPRTALSLGICLGAQIMTRAMGGVVRPSSQEEIGWAPIELTDAGRASVLAPLDGCPCCIGMVVCGRHPGSPASRITPACAVQAFSVGTHALAFTVPP